MFFFYKEDKNIADELLVMQHENYKKFNQD